MVGRCIWVATALFLTLGQAKDYLGWVEQSDGSWKNLKTGEVYGAKDTSNGANDLSKDRKKGSELESDVGKSSCTNTEQGDDGWHTNRTCITSASNDGTGPRCWWTHQPTVVSTTTKVPLVIVMHGGGGCASDAVGGQGFKELSDSLQEGSFITVYPQGANKLWASCGSEPSKCTTGKQDMAGWDDLGFLEQMIANVVASKPVDPEQIYVTGFSLGCMMAQRFAMERSKLVAGLGCHGGELSGVGIEPAAALDSYKSRYDIQAMPIYNTGGSADVWITRAGAGNDDFSNWLYWNGCSNSTTSDMTLTSSKLTAAIERTGSSCATYVPTLETKMVVITGLGHVHDPRMAKYIWDFLSQYKRPGAATQLPEAVAEIDPASIAVTVTNSVRQHAPPRLWRIAACLLLLTLFSCV